MKDTKIKKIFTIITKIWFFISIVAGILFLIYNNFIKNDDESELSNLPIDTISALVPINKMKSETIFNIPKDFTATAFKESYGEISNDNIINYILFLESDFIDINSLKKCYNILGDIIKSVRKIDYESYTVKELLFYIDDLLSNEYGINKIENGDYLFANDLISYTTDCDTRSFIFLAIADAMNWPVYGVHVPGHMFVRWDDGLQKINFETTTREIVLDIDYLDAYIEVDLESIRNNVYMNNLSHDQIIGSVEYNIGSALEEEGDIDSAVMHFENALRFYPIMPELIFKLTYIYGPQKEGVTDSIDLINTALGQAPSFYSLFVLRSMIQDNMDLDKEAIYSAISAYVIAPKDANVLWNLGALLYTNGQLTDAIRFTEEALKYVDEKYNIYLDLGIYYLLNNNDDQSDEYYKKAFKISKEKEAYEDAINNLKYALEIDAYDEQKQIIQDKINSMNKEYDKID